jgi:hypothetical protein
MDSPSSNFAVPDVHQPWYADDTGAGGQFKRIRLKFEKLQELRPLRGYFPEPDKSNIVVMEHNKEKAETEFADLVFQSLPETDTLEVSLGKRRPIRRLLG